MMIISIGQIEILILIYYYAIQKVLIFASYQKSSIPAKGIIKGKNKSCSHLARVLYKNAHGF